MRPGRRRGVERVGTRRSNVLEAQPVRDDVRRDRILSLSQRAYKDPDGDLPKESENVPVVVLNEDPPIGNRGHRRRGGIEIVGRDGRSVQRVEDPQVPVPGVPVEKSVGIGDRDADGSDRRAPQDRSRRGVEADVLVGARYYFAGAAGSKEDRGTVIRRSCEVEQAKAARLPCEAPGRGIKCVHGPGVCAGVDVALGHEWWHRDRVVDRRGPDQCPAEFIQRVQLRSRESDSACIRDAAGNGDTAPGEVPRLVRPRECSGRLINRKNLATESQPEDESVRREQLQVGIDIDPDASVDDPQGVARRRVQRI